ncbi:MAG: universal stress protein, partial [Pseudomonadota bacterium]
MRNGPIFISAIRQVLETGHDLVMKAAAPETDLFFLGDDLHLMRKCPCPVWILKEEPPRDADAPRHTILAAVDPDPEDAARDALAHTVLTLASSLAERTGARLHVINAWHVPLEPAMRSARVKMRPSEIEGVIESERRQSAQRLEALLADIADPTGGRVAAHRKGAAGDVVPAYAAEIGADTLVMGTVGRTGLSGFFIGNSAEMILNRIRCAALTTKPEGFVSPVAPAG